MSSAVQPDLPFRDAMAALSAAVNVVTTDGQFGRCGITATAVCSVTDSPPTVMVCINRNSEMNSVFKQNGYLCINILNCEQEQLAKHFAGMASSTMEERFGWDIWDQGSCQQPVLREALANLEGRIEAVQTVGSHDVYMVRVEDITLGQQEQGLIYFKRRFHQVGLKEEPLSA